MPGVLRSVPALLRSAPAILRSLALLCSVPAILWSLALLWSVPAILWSARLRLGQHNPAVSGPQRRSLLRYNSLGHDALSPARLCQVPARRIDSGGSGAPG